MLIEKLLFYSSWRGTQKHYIYDMRMIVMKIILDFVTNSSETDYYDCGDDCGYGWDCNECYE